MVSTVLFVMTISIIIPCYNAGKTLQKCLDSALNQGQKPYEVICVDDASTDNTPELLRSYGTRIKVITHTVNQGLGITRSDGIKAASGDYLYFLDSDDWIEPYTLESLVEALDDADIVTGGIDSTPLSGIEAQKEYESSTTTFLCNRLIKKSLLDKEPMSDLRYFEDLDIMPRLLYRAKKVAFAKKTGYHYEPNENSLTTNATETKHLVYKVLVTVNMCLYFAEHQPDWVMGLDLPGKIIAGLWALYMVARQNPDEFNKFDTETDMILRRLTTLLVQAQKQDKEQN